jgi:hypothetical protein
MGLNGVRLRSQCVLTRRPIVVNTDADETLFPVTSRAAHASTLGKCHGLEVNISCFISLEMIDPENEVAPTWELHMR